MSQFLFFVVALLATALPARGGDFFASNSANVTVTCTEKVVQLDERKVGLGVGNLLRQSTEIADQIGKFQKEVEIAIVADGTEKIAVGKKIVVEVPYTRLGVMDNANLLVRLRALDLGRKSVAAGDPACMGVMLKVVLGKDQRPEVVKAIRTNGILKQADFARLDKLTDQQRTALPSTLWLVAEHWVANKKTLADLLKLEPKDLPNPADALKWLDETEPKKDK